MSGRKRKNKLADFAVRSQKCFERARQFVDNDLGRRKFVQVSESNILAFYSDTNHTQSCM